MGGGVAVTNCFSPLDKRTYNVLLDERGRVVSLARGVDSGAGLVIDCRSEDLVLFPCSYSHHTHLFSASVDTVEDLYTILGRGRSVRLRDLISYWVSHGVCGGALTARLEDYDDVLSEYSLLSHRLRESIALGVVVERIDEENSSRVKSLVDRGVVEIVSILDLPSSLEGVGGEVLRDLHSTVFLDIHLSMSKKELLESRRKYNAYPVELAYRKGVLGEKTRISCTGWAASWELGLVAETRTSIALCPSLQAVSKSNGLLYYDVLREKNVEVGFGTGPQPFTPVWLEAWSYVILQRQVYGTSTNVSVEEAAFIATRPPKPLTIDAAFPFRLGVAANVALYPASVLDHGDLLVGLITSRPVYIVLNGSVITRGLREEGAGYTH